MCILNILMYFYLQFKYLDIFCILYLNTFEMYFTYFPDQGHLSVDKGFLYIRAPQLLR